ncbi:hypothetical protein L207DRAFT_80626 [Hyaloscypha variabilis F]|uniref:Nephrocystin 3-like N-terminal domain-containing protein n=1 Tax=Hyaloscypha variabilis (strain UAMH 11265 / GT02V1 / F) TaxID=1149755 RepID=A0A2J6RGU3_HYAVF|nr:hypothetical protein L207DRAFT_80626 [Hyaloscypha variabilis F]
MQGQRRLEKQVESLQSGFYYDIHGAMASSTRDNEEVLKTSDKRLVTLENTVREISNRMQFSSRLVEGELEAERRVKVLQWISPEQYQSRHQALINDIQFDSWSWVYHTPAFEKWYSKNMPPILFIIGPAKSGKSTILAQIIDDLQHHNGYHMPSNLFTPYGNPPSSMVLYFHCRPYNSHSAILGSLLRQLCCQDSATFHLLQAEYENELYHGFPSGSMQSAKLMKHLRSFFTRLLEQRQRTIYIVIGDLERRNFSRKEVLLMSALGELTRVCPGYCKVLIAARELPLGFTKLVIDQNLFFERVQIDRYKFYRQLVEAELKIFAEAFQIPLEQSGTYYMMSKETQGRLARDFLAHESEPWPNWGDETFRNRVLNRFLNAFNSEEKMRKTTASSQDVIDQRETTKQEEMHRPVTPTAFAFSAAERAGGRTDKMHQATFSQDSSRKSPTWRPGRLSSLPTK